MTVIIENEQEQEIAFDYEEFLTRVISATLKQEACPYEAEVSLVITDDETIQEYNGRFRQKDVSTDVLSFPVHEYSAPAFFEELVLGSDDFNPETGELLLGDIMISYEHVQRQAEEYGHSLQRELGFLTVHSILHLIGYDHETEEERLQMEQKQEEILCNMGITRD